jgi:dolichol-phosphate mannosyltransferase
LSHDVELTVALPAYEEGPNLVALLPALRAVLDDLRIRYEILIADTPEPRDNTPAVCAENGVRYLPRTGGMLYSHAVQTAIAASRGRWVVFMDADGSHDPAQVGRLWLERNNADLVIASRYTRGGKTDNPAVLIAMSLAVNVAFRVTLGLTCADVSNSFRLYVGDDLRALTLDCENFDIVEEILVKLCYSRDSYVVKEIPSTFGQRKSGKTKRDLRAFALSYVSTLRRLHALKRSVEKGRT